MLPGPPQLGSPASYFMCTWLAASSDEAFQYWDELDEERWSIRCVRKYRDGSFEAYSYDSPNWRDEMPEAPIPPVQEVNQDAQFDAREISGSEFEAIWQEAGRAMTRVD